MHINAREITTYFATVPPRIAGRVGDNSPRAQFWHEPVEHNALIQVNWTRDYERLSNYRHFHHFVLSRSGTNQYQFVHSAASRFQQVYSLENRFRVFYHTLREAAARKELRLNKETFKLKKFRLNKKRDG